MTKPPFNLMCSICCRPVKLETTNTDERGHAIHEECYILKLKLLRESSPLLHAKAA
jgi:hypothetical protein